MIVSKVEGSGAKFKTVRLEPGFNLVLARQEVADGPGRRRKSTNGSGKTLLLLICHFCLGSDSVRRRLEAPELAGWEFTITIEIGGRPFRASRSIDDPARVRVEGDFGDWQLQPKRVGGSEESSFAAGEWKDALGAELYGLDPEDASKMRPSFGSLFRYAVRRGAGAFTDPFRSFAQQRVAERDVSNAQLLGLDWGPFRDAHRLLARRDMLTKTGQGIAEVSPAERGGDRTLGRLEADLKLIESAIGQRAERLGDFRVHPRYREIEQAAAELGEAIRGRTADAVARREALGFYRQAVEEEFGPGAEEVERLYVEAEADLGDLVVRRLEEAEEFARRIAANRRESLEREIRRLEAELAQIEGEVEELDSRRSAALASIDGSGPLEEYTQIRGEQQELIERRGALRREAEQIRGLEERLASVALDLDENQPAAIASLRDGEGSRRRIAELFEQFTGELFADSGSLRIEVARYGKLKLETRIAGAGSQGVQEMLVFSYDLALAVAMAERGFGPGLLFHDSTIFDGVDERQKETALRMAYRESEKHGFQYLLCINEGDLPSGKIRRDALEEFNRVTLTDVDDGGLLGIRY
jgi:uncharacterized protein YydD (DUF2326 family)